MYIYIYMYLHIYIYITYSVFNLLFWGLNNGNLVFDLVQTKTTVLKNMVFPLSLFSLQLVENVCASIQWSIIMKVCNSTNTCVFHSLGDLPCHDTITVMCLKTWGISKMILYFKGMIVISYMIDDSGYIYIHTYLINHGFEICFSRCRNCICAHPR